MGRPVLPKSVSSNTLQGTFYLLTFHFMSETKLIPLVACVKPNHPSGQRNRAGFTFTTFPKVYEVTFPQEAMIRDDQFLRIIERGTAFEDAMIAYRKSGGTLGTKAKANVSQEANLTPPATIVVPPVTTDLVPNAADLTSNEGSGKDPADIPPADTTIVPPVAPEGKPIGRMNKEELIAGLEKKGLKSGTDFQPDASNKNLAALLSSL